MIEDKKYCSSSFLIYRSIIDESKCFSLKYPPFFVTVNKDRIPVYSSAGLESLLKKYTQEAFKKHKVALCLSGGIDSAILAKFCPKGTTCYTFRCIVPGVEVTNEVPQAAIYAKECGLKQKVVEIYWEDFEKYTDILMKHKGAPIHSIEVQIYKAALQAKKDGFDALLFGETADVNYGGFDGLLSKDFSFEDFKKRYINLDPTVVLNDPIAIDEPIEQFVENGIVNVHEFLRNVFYREALNSYVNACSTAGMEFIAPFTKTFLGNSLDLSRIRHGENKYMVREVFHHLFPCLDQPKKIPMPRATNEWLKDWACPSRKEFKNNIDYSKLTGDQKWLIWTLNRFLELIDN